MLLMSACQSNKTAPEVKTIYVLPEIYFPTYPAPRNNVIPLDQNNKRVTDNETTIENVLMPYWYYKLIVEYKLQVDEAEAKYNAYYTRLNK